jgi:hypothetical protein
MEEDPKDVWLVFILFALAMFALIWTVERYG